MKTLTALPPLSLTDSEHSRIVMRPPRRNDRGIVDLGEAVVYRDQNTGRTRRVRVVPPDAADPMRGHISAASPVGAALIGLGEGQTADWQDRSGKRRTLRVLRIEDHIEPVGYLDI